MNSTDVLEPPPAAAGAGAARQRRPRRASSLFANGEPWIWLTGGALALAMLMILGLLALVLYQGLPSFWPGRVTRLETVDGRTVLGEVQLEERYRPEPTAFDVLPEERRAAARTSIEAADGESVRRLLRSGNFDLTGTHYTWVSDFELAGEDRPQWALVVERLTWGRFYGLPKAIRVPGQEIEGDRARIWELYQQHHPLVRERWRERRGLEKHAIGRVNARSNKARLAREEARLEHGEDSPQWRAADEHYQAVKQGTDREFERISAEIQAIDEVNSAYQLVLQAPDGQEKVLGLDEIVRAYPANRLGLVPRLGLYASRLVEFLTDEPRNANSEGGVYPAIFGTVAMTLIMSVLVVPFGVLAALYLREYARQGAIVSTVRIAINNLAGVPSIVFGVFGLGFFCYIMGARIDELFFPAVPGPTYAKGGLLWASLTLALLTLPVVIVPTEEALAAVPGSMREGSYACGATKWQTIRRIVLPRALPGIMTGMILAVARGAGEVAPLMLVGAVDWVEDLPVDGTAPFVHPQRSFMHLGYHIYDLGFQSQNSEAAKPMVYTTTLLLISIVVVLNLLAIWIRARLRRRFVAGT